uniref:PH domain-containing protein n=2 Tax=Felinae TaxID=338152 RepID=A0ABI7ZCE8_FELCA
MQKSTNSDTSVDTLNSTRQGTGAVQMRIKNANSHHDRLSQSKSMILTDVGKVIEPISRHRRNHSQHVLKDVIPPLEQLMVEKEGYLQKAKIADGGKKLRKNWSTSWIVLSSRKIEFYKESKQQALANMKTGHKPESVDLCGAHIEWAKEKSSRKNVFQGEIKAGSRKLQPLWHCTLICFTLLEVVQKKLEDCLFICSSGQHLGKLANENVHSELLRNLDRSE